MVGCLLGLRVLEPGQLGERLLGLGFWASDSQSAASWASASWVSASWSDNAEGEAPSEEGEYLSDAELQEFAADLGIVDPVAETGDSADTITSPLP